ncbi:MAG: ankyrin repeat domain-containing protein [Planctomycetota bacterium]|jgi:ankyrin repeat protein
MCGTLRKTISSLAVVALMVALAGCRKSLHEAVQYNDLETVKHLIRKGVNVNAQNEDGETPLHIAAILGRTKAGELLIDNGADIHARTNAGRTPLHTACSSGEVAVAKLLVEKGADISALDQIKGTPLHTAGHGCNPQIVKLLVEKGADVNARDRYGHTPLYWAVSYGGYGHREIVQTLLSLGASVLMEKKTGSSPLGLASLEADLTGCEEAQSEAGKTTC